MNSKSSLDKMMDKYEKAKHYTEKEIAESVHAW